MGFGVGLVASLSRRTIDLSLVTLGLAFVPLLDLDHLPSVLGVEQPIRPAHSLGFLAIGLVVLYFVAARGRPEIPVIAASAFLAHIASDTGLFAFYVPVSFNYVSLNEFRIPFALGAVGLAILAGYLKSRRLKRLSHTCDAESIEVKGVIK